MKTITINLYRFSELSDQSKNVAKFNSIQSFQSFIYDLRKNRMPKECYPSEFVELAESEEHNSLPKETRVSRIKELFEQLAIKNINKRWFLEDGRPHFQWKMPDDVWNNE